MYDIKLTHRTRKYLRKLPEHERTRIVEKLEEIRENPLPYLKKLKIPKLWRLRVGKYRAIVDVVIKGKRIIVLRIGKRDGVY